MPRWERSKNISAGWPNPVTPGRWLGVDVGAVRVGVAESDPDGILATPVSTLERDLGPEARDRHTIAGIVRERAVTLVVVGLPRSMRGEDGEAARLAREYAQELAGLVAPVRVRLVDERLTTVQSHRHLQASGRRERDHRSVVDQVAAVLILQGAVESSRLTGRLPGEVVETGGRKPRRKGRG